MALKTRVTGSGWSAIGGGAPSAGNTGLATCTTFSTYTAFSGEDPAPKLRGGGANPCTGYISAAKNTTCSFKLDANYSTELGSDNQGVLWRARIRLRVVTASEFPADGAGSYSSGPSRIADSGTKLRFYIVATRGRGGTHPANEPGLTMLMAQGASFGGTVNALDNGNASGSPALIAPGEWGELAILAHRGDNSGGNNGVYGAYWNGQCFATITGIDLKTGTDTTTSILAADLTTNDFPLFSLGAIAGCAWDVCGPIESYSYSGSSPESLETANPGEFTALWDECWRSGDDLHFVWPVDFLDKLGGRWNTSATGGTPTFAVTTYSGSGNHPRRKRIQVSMTAVNNGARIKSRDVLPAPRYNELGWYEYLLPMVYLPHAGTTATFQIRNAGDTGDLVTVAFSGGNVSVNGVNQFTYTTTDRWQMVVSVNQDGRIWCVLHNLSVSNDSTRRTWSADCGVWSVAAPGYAQWDLTSTATNVPEIDGLEGYLWCDIGLPDSLSQTIVTGMTPNCTIANHWAEWLGFPMSINAFPGCAYQGRNSSALAFGVPRVRFSAIFGYTGHTWKRTVDSEVVPGLAYAAGCRFWIFDGGVTNDIWQNVSSDAVVDAQVALWVAASATFLDTVLSNNKVVFTTHLPREYEAAVTITGDGTWATVTYASHGYDLTLHHPTIVKAATPTFDVQYMSGTAIDANSFKYASSIVGAGVAAYCRFYSDAMIRAGKVYNRELALLCSRRQVGGRIQLVDVAARIQRPAESFAGTLSLEIHEAAGTNGLNNGKLAIRDAVIAGLGSTLEGRQVSAPSGWTRGLPPKRRTFGVR